MNLRSEILLEKGASGYFHINANLALLSYTITKLEARKEPLT